MEPNMKKLMGIALSSLLLATSASATSLKQILNYALTYDPTLDEARANIFAAEEQTKISEAGHLPIFSATGTSVIAQKHTHTSDRRSGPGVAARMNIYSWGAVEAEIDRDKHREEFYQHRFSETRELVGQQVGGLYLTALRAKENIVIYKESLKRHDKMLADLKIITTYDPGRNSEMNEALSRRNQVESTLLQQEKIMYTTLSRLSRYSKAPLTEKDLVDPFAKETADGFVRQFHNPDIKTNPSYLAQEKEFDSARSAVEAANARRKPSINLEGTATRHEREVYLTFNWDFYNPAAKHTEQQSFYSKQAAEAKLRDIELTVEEQARTAEVDMQRNQQLAKVAHKQIALQRNVVQDTELQFEIGMKSLMDVLNSYQELTGVQAAEIAARNDFRDAALLYLVSQSRMAHWAGVVLPTTNKK
ncbi:transporter [Pasteurellaceae bacterium 15-036681]|nr:transporter [Pasteurellaceae bacterium 15-036681]